jgi:hypothetical protein
MSGRVIQENAGENVEKLQNEAVMLLKIKRLT